MQVKKKQLELDMAQQTGSKSGEDYIMAVYCHPAYLIRAFVFHDPPSPCILGTHHEKGAQTFWSVVNRLPLSSNAVLCWKFCHVFHKLLRDGHPNVSACGCSGWAGSLGPTWGKCSCLSHRGHCPLR